MAPRGAPQTGERAGASATSPAGSAAGARSGVWQVATAASRQMREGGQGGSIINISSIVGLGAIKNVGASAVESIVAARGEE